MWRMHYTIARNIFKVMEYVSGMRLRIQKPEEYSDENCYEYAKGIVSRMQKTGHIRTEGFGMENLPAEGGYMLYPNHQGKYDAYGLISVHSKPCTVVMDDAKSHMIFIREIIDMLRGKRMNIHDARQGLTIINQITEEVSQGRRYILFPEGGYGKDQKNTLGDFKPGCFRISLRSGTPIVPVVLYDSYKVFNSWQLKPVTTQVHFLEPIYYDEYKELKTVQVAALVKERIQQKLDEIEGKTV
ncbi:MAG: 1-acyl-sn-glycerol-3-phosphate acyltransferase [Oscillospiraceae bacterium]|nr:1-acyl-sn-glycerol-3-phosphate acyltransferase [Oscillospiraceae bacterium]